MKATFFLSILGLAASAAASPLERMGTHPP